MKATRRTILSTLAAAGAAAAVLPAFSEDPPKPKTEKKKDDKGKEGKGKDDPKTKKEGPPAPETVELTTKDLVKLACTYYPSPTAKEGGKQVVPVLLVHGWKQSRGDVAEFALNLQAAGFAVLAPDLRAHGESVWSVPTGGKSEKKIEPAQFKKETFETLRFDFDACKSFLRKRNNEGQLNLEALAVVASDITAIAALNWTVADWEAAVLTNYKNAQDVKAVVLLSPKRTEKGFTLSFSLSHPAVVKKAAVMVCYGKKGRAAAEDAKGIFSTLQQHYKEYDEHHADFDAKPAELRLWKWEEDTPNQGVKLLGTDPGLQTRQWVYKFLYDHLAAKIKNFEWTERVSPND